jgi:ArsR family transcriptional regulator
MTRFKLTPETMVMVAERFRALGEPARLQILDCLRGGEMTVGDLVDETGFGQANVSKHLNLLRATAFVRRRKEGLFVYYSLADKGVLQLCDTMCGRLQTGARRMIQASA